MSDGPSMPLDYAAAVAKGFVALVSEACVQVHIAGSVRRRMPECHDIEIVYQPRMIEVGRKGGDLFRPSEPVMGSAVRPVLLSAFESGLLAKGPRFGPKYQQVQFGGVSVDLFSAPAESLGWILVLRTGPKEWLLRLLVALRTQGVTAESGRLYRGIQPIPTPTEHEVFAAAGLPFVAPEDRHAQP